MELLQISVIYLIGFIVGLIVGKRLLSNSSQTMADFVEYIIDDMEITYINGSRELIHEVAQVEINDNFILMLDVQGNIKAIIPNKEIEHIKVLERT